MAAPFDPNAAAARNLALLRRDPKKIYLVNTGPRDTGQSDYKNRHSFKDLISLAPIYERGGYFAVEMHGGARFHQDLMHNKVDPFEEARAWKMALPTTMTQTLIRSTNAFGYRAYPRNVIRRTVEAMLPTIDVWRCFDFLNHIPNMVHIGTQVLEAGRIFQPAISFTDSPGRTDAYYLGVVEEIVKTFGGEKAFILAIKDMAGTGSPARMARLVDAMLQRWPDLIIDYHRHATDGLGVPALVEAAVAGARILDVTDDAFTRFYGQCPVGAVTALLRERGLEPVIEDEAIVAGSQRVGAFIRDYEEFESPFKGFSYGVVDHRMPGGAFPSSFEQAEKGGFLELMPAILRGMSLGNRLIRYFDVTPGSQITWTTWAAIIQRLDKQEGSKGIERVLDTLARFIAGGQKYAKTTVEDRQVLRDLYQVATDDLKSLLLGGYGPLPFGWPADWVYESVFGPEWKAVVKERRTEESPALALPDEDLDATLARFEKELGRAPTEEEFILYLQHPQATLDFIAFRDRFGSTVDLPTDTWLHGLRRVGDAVDFELGGKPQRFELVSVGQVGADGLRHIVISVNNSLMVFKVEMPDVAGRAPAVRMAEPAQEGHVGAPVGGNLWRIGNRDRILEVGDFVQQGEEVANLEVMKTENAIHAPVTGTIAELVAAKNDAVEPGQLLMVVTPAEQPTTVPGEKLL